MENNPYQAPVESGEPAAERKPTTWQRVLHALSLILGFAAALVLFFRPMSFGLAVWLLIGAGACAFASVRRRG